MVNLQNKVTTYDVTTEYNNIMFTGIMTLDSNNALKSINGHFDENNESLGSLYYDILDDGTINKNLNNIQLAREDELNAMVTTLIADCKESIISE